MLAFHHHRKHTLISRIYYVRSVFVANDDCVTVDGKHLITPEAIRMPTEPNQTKLI